MKEKFIRSTIILLIGGLITKVLGMLIKIVMARIIGTKGLGMYMLILPTFSLLISLSQFGFPIALSKLISEERKNNKKLFFSILPILIIINIFLIVLIIIMAPFISNNLLHNKDTYLSIIAISLVIPFTSISSICRSYFFGKQKMLPHVISNIIENIIRLLIIIIILPFILPLGLKYTVCFLVLSNVISEITSTLVLLLFLPKNIEISRKDLIPDKLYIKDSLKISIPNTTNRLIGSIAYFLEPIILTSTLLKNYSMHYITLEYGIISGYVMPIILLPSFFTLAISQALLPNLSCEYANGNIKNVRRKLKLSIFLSLLIGIPLTLLLTINPTVFLQTIYHTNEGEIYIRLLAPICLIQYIQYSLTTTLEAIGKSKDNMYATIIGTLSRTILLYLLSLLRIGMYSLIISISVNIILTTLYQIYKIKKYLRK